MRILYISAEPLRPHQASNTHVNEVARYLRSAAHDVVVHASRAWGSYESTPLVQRFRSYLSFWFGASRLLRNVDVVYARAHPANLPVACLARLKKIPIVHEINGSYRDLGITYWWLRPILNVIGAIMRVQFRAAAALIAVTEGLADWVQREAPGIPVQTIPNGVNCDIFLPECAPVRPVTCDYALYFGTMARWHGIEGLIAAATSPAWPASLDLVLVGDGQLGALARAASDRYSNIHYLPPVAQAVLAGYIAGASLGLATISSPVGRGQLGLSPLKLYEMLACGLPVIVTDFPGQADLVRSLDAGIVVPPNDPLAIAAAAAMLHSNPPTRTKRMQVASTILAAHTWEIRSRLINEILARVASVRSTQC